MSVSNSIKALRLKFNLTQLELAEIAGVTDKAVSCWELGKSAPRMGAIEKIAKHFNLTNSEVISFGSEEEAETYTDEELEIIRVYRSLNADGKAFVEHIKELLRTSPKYYDENESEEKL